MDENNRLREIRIKEGLTIEELAKASGVSNRTITRAEGKKGTPSEVSLYKILKGLKKKSEKEYSYEDVFGANRKSLGIHNI